uniref:FAM192A/Fyv6 N-terminal domain-containing protein n=1 Tax=Panagrolaimus sp. PS1159 TaxID=55785 RepID=A0AC35F3D9_9BILA
KRIRKNNIMEFVSEKELEAKAAEGKDSEPIDERPLFFRLKEVRDKAQAEKDEQFALKNQFRGIDEDESDFLDKINQFNDKMERKRKEEEKELLKKALRVDAEASSSSAITITSLKPKMEKLLGNSSSTVKSQKETLKKLVVKRKAPTEAENPEIKQKKIEPVEEKKEEVKEVPKKIVGLLQGYSSSEEED